MFYKKFENYIEFSVLLTPNAKKESINEIITDDKDNKLLKVSVHAKPEDNKANEALIKLLSKTLHIPKSKVIIKRGHKSRIKTIHLIGVEFINI